MSAVRSGPRAWPGVGLALMALWLVCPAASAGAAAPPSATVLAALTAAQSVGNTFPPADEVFHFKAVPGVRHVRLQWTIRPGYYLYRARIRVMPLSGTVLGRLTLPPGQVKVDPYFGREQIYRLAVTGTLAVIRGTRAAAHYASFAVTYQGCADRGLCYPPITRDMLVALPRRMTSAGGAARTPSGASGRPGGVRATPVSQTRFADLVRSGSLLAMLGAFYLAGLALSFTPCCLPMIPILSGLIAGGRRPGTGRSLALAIAYVLGMACTYTLAGIAAAAAGGEIQAAFQQPWIVGAFAALLAAMGLAMLGLFTVQMPAGLQARLTELSNRRSAGTLGGVAVMGALSALIVTTCVAPALVGALAVIGQSGQVVRGGMALFALSIGMGTPLIALGASAGRLLPKAGPWMVTVKKIFGAVMLAVAVWMLSRLLPARVAVALWALPVLAGAWALWSSARGTSAGQWTLRAAGIAACVYAMILVAGSLLGSTQPLSPLSFSRTPHLHFTPVGSVAQVRRAVRRAAAAHRAVMVDFYADWCVSCKEMDATTFANPAVRQALAGTVLLRADVTANTAADQALLKYFGIYGPPSVAFYSRSGRPRKRFQVVGYLDAKAFLRRLHAVFAPHFAAG